MSSNEEGNRQAMPQREVGDEIKSDPKQEGGSNNVSGEKIQLFDASKMGFNDRAWNDPPPLLMNNSVTLNVAPSSGRKLNTRVAFPLNSAAYPTSDKTARIPLNPNAPPPTGGFVNPASKTQP
ncbi:unnamed protein product [Orchesella dallaii]|uniref:Uncharacterized protein n=1 Tax=Orchesella dallaii TaxID=48710 RepID=A0ABP1RSF1_9HEXA